MNKPNTPRVITGEISVWLTQYSSIGPAELTSDDAQKVLNGVSFSHHDMAPEWTRIGAARVTITLESNDKIITGKVDALRAEQKKVVADAQMKSTDIERQIQQLLAITHEPAVTE